MIFSINDDLLSNHMRKDACGYLKLIQWRGFLLDPSLKEALLLFRDVDTFYVVLLKASLQPTLSENSMGVAIQRKDLAVQDDTIIPT